MDGHDVDVIEMVDEDVAWFQLAVDGEMLPFDVQPGHVPGEAEAASLLREWQARAR